MPNPSKDPLYRPRSLSGVVTRRQKALGSIGDPSPSSNRKRIRRSDSVSSQKENNVPQLKRPRLSNYQVPPLRNINPLNAVAEHVSSSTPVSNRSVFAPTLHVENSGSAHLTKSYNIRSRLSLPPTDRILRSSRRSLHSNPSAELRIELERVPVSHRPVLRSDVANSSVHSSPRSSVTEFLTMDASLLSWFSPRRLTAGKDQAVKLKRLNTRRIEFDVLELSQSVEHDASILTNESILNQSIVGDPLEKLLSLCGQSEVKPFNDCFDADTLDDVVKIGEGVYGEVFQSPKGHVIKIFPVDGETLVNGENQMTFPEVYPEVFVSKATVVRGLLPETFSSSWRKFKAQRGSENECPDFLPVNQKWMVLEFEFAGEPLANVRFNTCREARSVIEQIALSLAAAESSLQFEHRDLHWHNILVRPTRQWKLRYRVGGVTYAVFTEGIQVTIIDFTVSRLCHEGNIVYVDMSDSPEIFECEGDYQFDIYRIMRDHNGNDWRPFHPITNLYWLHYLMGKLLNETSYPRRDPDSQPVESELRALYDMVLSSDYKSTMELNGEFNGVMRFFYQDECQRYQTKCIRVSSMDKTVDIVETLREKFFPLESAQKESRFGIYEHHINGVRRLTNDEYPLMVQLNWSKNDREGKFVLKLESPTDCSQLNNGSAASGRTVMSNGRVRRRWSLRREKPASVTTSHERRGPLGCAAVVGWNNKHMTRPRPSLPEPSFNCLVRPQPGQSWTAGQQRDRLNQAPPDSTFTRTISNPEQAMQRKRQLTLEAKLLQILQQGGPEIGGTLKIYGGQVCPQVPYKTLLLSVSDSVASVIRQALDKYGLEEADPEAYCLVMRIRGANDASSGGTETVLADTDCPLGHLFTSSPEAGSVVTFELRSRPPHLLSKRPFSHGTVSQLMRGSSGTGAQTSGGGSVRSTQLHRTPSSSMDTAFACLIELVNSESGDAQGSDGRQNPASPTGMAFPLPVHKGQVCVGTSPIPDSTYPYIVTLPLVHWPGVELHHLIIWRPPVPPGVTATMAAVEATQRRGGWLACRPCVRSGPQGRPLMAKVWVNNQPLTQTARNRACVYWLSPGDLIHLGQGRRCLQIWPGNGSSGPPVKMLNNRPDSSLSISRGTCCYPEVPKHRRTYNPTVQVSISGGSPVQNTAGNGVAYLSPLIHSTGSSSSVVDGVPSSSPRSFQAISPQFPQTDSPRDTVHTPFDSVSASTSSLSSNNAATVTLDQGLAENVTSVSQSSRSVSHATVTLPSRPSAAASQASVMVELSEHKSASMRGRCTTATVSIQSVTPFRPIPVRPVTIPHSTQASLEEDQLEGLSADHELQSTTPPPKLHPAPPAIPCSSNSAPSQPTLDPASKTTRSKSSASSTSTSSTISDRLPCQMAFAPTTVRHLLDSIITLALTENRSGAVASSLTTTPLDVATCSLGPGVCVYLMLRAIHRQCDRWEMMELRQALKEAGIRSRVSSRPDEVTSVLRERTALIKSKLLVHQRDRRQRELLRLLRSAVERFQRIESILSDRLHVPYESSDSNGLNTQNPPMHPLVRPTAAWLANASQLLHFVTRDVDFSRTFDTHPTNEPSETTNLSTAWSVAQDQLTDVAQSAFGILTEACVTHLDSVSIPQLLAKFALLVENDFAEDQFQDEEEEESDAVLQMLTVTLDTLYTVQVNPAFVVQLFARLLHRLNARLFHFLLGIGEADDGTSPPPTTPHISQAWGRVVYRWIRGDLCAWAITEGLGVATECYLQRVSQASELMMADISSVESLYNVAVDLVGLNSSQVHAILSGFNRSNLNKPQEDSNANADDGQLRQNQIPANWIEFVVSGVKMVADRILAEDATNQSAESINPGDDNAWTPSVAEPLDLLLPLLLPEDSYPSDNPISADQPEEPVSSDSGISSRPGSAKSPESGAVNAARQSTDALIIVESIRSFLTPAIKVGWCRLSVRPIFPASSSNTETVAANGATTESRVTLPALSWSVYLQDAAAMSPDRRMSASMRVDEEELADHSVTVTEQNGQLEDCSNRKTHNESPSASETWTSTGMKPGMTFVGEKRVKVIGSMEDAGPETLNQPEHFVSSLCPSHRPLTVIVPKYGHSLGLNIVAARSEDGRDLGIYVRGIVPDSGASQARLKHPTSHTTVPLQPGDHLLAVNNQSVLGLSQEAAAHLVSSAGSEVCLTVVHNPCMHAALSTDRDPSSSSLCAELETASHPDCPECELTASLRTSPVSLVTAETRVRTRDCGDIMLADAGTELPPKPSALGPVMHLARARPRVPSGVEWIRTQDEQRLDATCDELRHQNETEAVSRTSTGASRVRAVTSIRVTGRLHATPTSSGTKPLDVDDSVLSECSLVTSSRSRSSMAPTDGGWFSQSANPVTCHRPKGQSASFDEWISASRWKDLSDRLASATQLDGMESVLASSEYSPRHGIGYTESQSLVASLPLNTHPIAWLRSASLVSPTAPSPLPDSRKLSNTAPRTAAGNVFSTKSSSSQAPSVFVPTASVLPSYHARRQSIDENPTPAFRTNSLPRPQPPNPWSSRSLGDLASLRRLLAVNSDLSVSSSSASSETQQSPWSTTTGITARAPAGRALQRRHTTLTTSSPVAIPSPATSRFKLGPRPEPPNQSHRKSQLTSLT